MKVQLESTTKIVNLVVDGKSVPARAWEGVSEGSVPCIAFITRIAVRREADNSQFERELQEMTVPSAESRDVSITADRLKSQC